MTVEDIKNNLATKLAILEKIHANTEAQGRFVRKHQLTGLNRLLRERAVLIEKLAAVNSRLSAENGWRDDRRLAAALQAVEKKQKETLSVCQLVVRQTMTEREQIREELYTSRSIRKAQRHYTRKWPGKTVVGNRLNVKG